jgi:hypothetical protein
MFTSWLKRKARLSTLLQSNGDEDQDGLALDRILHGQSVIAKTAKTIEVDKLRFTDKDLSVIGTLEYGQFSIVRRGSSWPPAISTGASMSASRSKNDLPSRLVTNATLN